MNANDQEEKSDRLYAAYDAFVSSARADISS